MYVLSAEANSLQVVWSLAGLQRARRDFEHLFVLHINLRRRAF